MEGEGNGRGYEWKERENEMKGELKEINYLGNQSVLVSKRGKEGREKRRKNGGKNGGKRGG
jgi:hypothetical protein